jgi:hypothetical protein
MEPTDSRREEVDPVVAVAEVVVGDFAGRSEYAVHFAEEPAGAFLAAVFDGSAGGGLWNGEGDALVDALAAPVGPDVVVGRSVGAGEG